MAKCPRAFFLLLLAMLPTLADVHAAPAKKVFRVRYSFDVCEPDWNLCSSSNDAWALKNIMEGLFEINGKGVLEPRLASYYAVSEDRKRITLHVRGDVRWSDGVLLEAQHFYDSWKRLLDPRTGSRNASIFDRVIGARDFHEGREADFNRVGIRLLDKETLELRLEEPAPFFAEMLAFWATYPIRLDLIEKYGKAWTDPENLVVLGPYKYASHDKGKAMVLARNTEYYGKAPEADEVHFLVIKDNDVATRRFKEGKLEHYWTPDLGAAKGIPKAQLMSYQAPGTTYLMFDSKAYPIEFRQAVAMAIDKKVFPKAFHQDMKPAVAITPPALFPMGAKTGLEFSPAKARAAQKKALVRDKKLSSVSLIAFDSVENRIAVKAVVAELKKNIGVKAIARFLDWDPFMAAMAKREKAIFLYSVNSDYLDPHSITSGFVTAGGSNKLGWNNLEYDQLISDASSLPNGVKRAELYRKALVVLQQEDSLVVPLFHIRVSYFLSPKIKHFKPTPIGDVYFREVTYKTASKH